MTIRKRRTPTPDFKLPPPYNPISGEQAPLVAEGLVPVVALMQVIEEDTYDNYLVCRGFDPKTKKFYESINIAKPYGVRGDNAYEVGQVICCAKPQTQLGTNPGRADETVGHPEDLDEEIVLLYDDDGVSPIEWLEIGGGPEVRHFELYDNHAPGATSTAYPRPWSGSAYVTDTDADTFEVVDVLKQFRGRGRDEGAGAEEDSGGTRGKHGSRGVAVMRHGQLEIEYLQPHATFITCLVNEASDFATSTEPVDVDSVQVIQPTNKALLMADVTTVVNIWDWAGLDDQRVKAIWNDSAGQWEMDMKKCNPSGE